VGAAVDAHEDQVVRAFHSIDRCRSRGSDRARGARPRSQDSRTRGACRSRGPRGADRRCRGSRARSSVTGCGSRRG
jgi:hypothetical protein